MDSALVKIKPEYVQTALAMTGISVNLQVAAIVQDVIHSLIDKHTSFSLEDAVEITMRHENEDLKNKALLLKERYRILSSLHYPKSKHKLQVQISEEMNIVLKELKTLTAS